MPNIHQLITETVPVFFFVYNLETRLIEYVSPQLYDMVKDQEKLESIQPHERLRSVIEPRDKEKFQQFFDDLSAQNNYEASVELRGGKELGGMEWLEINSFRPKKSKNSAHLVIGHIVDITEKKRQYLRLREENESIENVLNMMAHDMRTPFSHIEMVVGQLLKKMTPEEKKKFEKYLSILLTTSKNSTALLNSLLSLATLKGETSKLDLDLQDMRFFIKGMLEKFEQKIDERNLRIHLDFPDYTVEAKIDEVLFQQVVYNLLSNAIKFTPEEGSIFISVSYNEKKEVVITIQDTGIGIPEKYLESLFQGLSQLRRKGLRGEHSTGLGLFICNQIIKVHEGRIYVSSVENEGAKFTIVLPKHGHSAAYF